MHPEFELLIEEAIRLELNVAELYLLFHRKLSNDATFWWQIALEEENHAALLKTARQMQQARLDIPDSLLPASVDDLKHNNARIRRAIAYFSDHADRSEAFSFAFHLEKTAGELHYNEFMKNGTDSHIMAVFRRLNGSDLDHAERIRNYMVRQGIPLGDAGLSEAKF